MLFLGLSRAGRRAAIVCGSVAIASTVACSDNAIAPVTAPASPAVSDPNLMQQLVVFPKVDGKIKFGEYASGDSIKFRIRVPLTKEVGVPATAYITHDKKYLYMAVTFDRLSPFHTDDGAWFEFDKDNDGIMEVGDETLGLNAYPAGTPMPVAGMDLHRTQAQNGTWYNEVDTFGGAGTNNALSAFGTIGTKGVFEIRQELNSADDANDISIDWSNGPVTVGMRLYVGLEKDPVGSANNVWSVTPTWWTYCQLTIGANTTSVSCP